MQISPHLCFDGQCEKAFRYYQQILGGTLETMLTYGDSPMAAEFESQWHDRILHATLRLDDYELLGADLRPKDYRKPQGFCVTLTIDELPEAERVFQSLASGGEIHVPFRPVFWSAGFGVLVDQFEVPWEINCGQPPSS